MFVEGLERPDEDPAVLQDAPHPEVDVLQHLAALSHRLPTNNDASSQHDLTWQKWNFHFPTYKIDRLMIKPAVQSPSPLHRKQSKWFNLHISD